MSRLRVGRPGLDDKPNAVMQDFTGFGAADDVVWPAFAFGPPSAEAVWKLLSVVDCRRSGGGPGTGKSHVATALGIQAIEHHRKKVRFFSTVELVNALEQKKNARKVVQPMGFTPNPGQFSATFNSHDLEKDHDPGTDRNRLDAESQLKGSP